MSYSSSATGILRAAGYGSRFDPSGLHNKLLATLPDGTPVVFSLRGACCRRCLGWWQWCGPGRRSWRRC